MLSGTTIYLSKTCKVVFQKKYLKMYWKKSWDHISDLRSFSYVKGINFKKMLQSRTKYNKGLKS